MIFLQIDKLTKNPNLKKLYLFFFFFLGGGGGGVVAVWGGGGGGGGSERNVQMFQMHFYSSRNTNVPNYSEIHA